VSGIQTPNDIGWRGHLPTASRGAQILDYAAALARAPRHDVIVAEPLAGSIADARHQFRSLASAVGIARVDRDHAGGVTVWLRAELPGRRHRVRVWRAAQGWRNADPGHCLRRRDDGRRKRRVRVASSACRRCSRPNVRRFRVGSAADGHGHLGASGRLRVSLRDTWQRPRHGPWVSPGLVGNRGSSAWQPRGSR
jgi:hypothetical protein